MAALRAMSGVLAYSVAKAGIDNFTRWLAVELATHRRGHVPPARDAAVEDVEDQGHRDQQRGPVEVWTVAGGEEPHRREEGRDAAEPVGDREEIGEVEVPQHREVPSRRGQR